MQSGKRIYGIAAAAIFALSTGFATGALAACKDCGTVVDVKTIKKEGEASGVGAVAGGFLVYFLARRSMLIGVLAGEAIMVAGAYFTAG